jgi:hypothetical protein
MILVEELGLIPKELHGLVARCRVQLLVEHSEVSSLQGLARGQGKGMKWKERERERERNRERRCRALGLVFSD